MGKQDFTCLDYVAPFFVMGFFAIAVTFFSIISNFLLIRKTDEVTAFEKLGAKLNVRLGPHRLSMVKEKLEKHVDEDGVEY